MLLQQAPSSQRPCVASRKHLSLQVSCCNLLTPNYPLIPISTSRRNSLSAHLDSSHRGLLRRHSLSTHLDPSHRGLLPVSHVFVDSSRLLYFLIAPPGHHCVRLLPVRAVVYHVWPSAILRLCPVLSTNRPAKSLFLPCHPWLAITCTASHALHSGLCTFCLVD